jgi:hypothetical protein
MNQLALTPAASAAAASTAIRVEVRNLTVTGPDVQTLLSAVKSDMLMVPDFDVDSDDLAAELMETIGRLATVSAAIEKERKERTAPLLSAQKWLMDGYSPARTQLDDLIAVGKAKLTAYNRVIAEAKRLADEAEAKRRRDEAAAAAKIEADAIASAQASARAAEELRRAGSEQAAQAMETQAMVQADEARQSAAVAVQAVYTAPLSNVAHMPLKGSSGTWSAEVIDKPALIQHIGAMIAKGDLSYQHLLDVSEKQLKALAKMQMSSLRLPGIKPVFTESISIRKQAVAA